MEPTLDEALLTAYLDGELAPEERQRLEQRLAEEPLLRQHLALLEETWHCLELLEQESVDTENIETTLKIAAVSMSMPLLSLKINRWIKWGLAALAGLALLVVTFHFGNWTPLSASSFRRMMERLDMYLVLADEENGLEFLQQLTEKRVFLPPSRTADSPIGSRTLVEDAELFRLIFYRNRERFLELDWEKAEQIHHLHIAVEEGHPELLLTLQNYYYWHKSLQSYERAALSQSQPLAKKVPDIIELKALLDRLQPEYADLMFSEIVGLDKSNRLVETLATLSIWEKNNLLSEEPIVIIHKLKQLVLQPSD